MQFPSEHEFNASFQARLKETRKGMHWTYPQMAHALDLKVDAYKKLENRPRASFPIHLLGKLIFITGRPINYWMGLKSAVIVPNIRAVR